MKMKLLLLLTITFCLTFCVNNAFGQYRQPQGYNPYQVSTRDNEEVILNYKYKTIFVNLHEIVRELLIHTQEFFKILLEYLYMQATRKENTTHLSDTFDLSKFYFMGVKLLLMGKEIFKLVMEIFKGAKNLLEHSVENGTLFENLLEGGRGLFLRLPGQIIELFKTAFFGLI